MLLLTSSKPAPKHTPRYHKRPLRRHVTLTSVAPAQLRFSLALYDSRSHFIYDGAIQSCFSRRTRLRLQQQHRTAVPTEHRAVTRLPPIEDFRCPRPLTVLQKQHLSETHMRAGRLERLYASRLIPCDALRAARFFEIAESLVGGDRRGRGATAEPGMKGVVPSRPPS